MAGETEAQRDALRADLTRTLELKERLEQSLAAADADRAELRREVRILDARITHLHGELAVAHRSQTDLHVELGAVHTERARLKTALDAALGRVEPPVAEDAEVVAREPAGEEPEAGKDAEEAQEAETRPVQLAPAPVAVEVRHLEKRFSIPAHQMETLKERVLHPLRNRHAQELAALRGVSLDVHEGEFLGIAGSNGSGKSTLLKVLASVYAADSGTVRIAGRVAPFIELGVGLNPELAAFDNVVMSGVMMGLAPDVARALYPEIIAFAGLEEFTKLKLKNYSSGMRVRLAFAVMAQVDADVLLVDEVLAVGDAEFRVKCLERLGRLRAEGKTIVFVSHAMDVMKKHCDRAILLDEGKIVLDGDPADVARRYLDREATDEQEAPLKVVEQ
jgi:ABC-type polysaccharide/polyol phosphate transport system ATPase subunit